MNKSKLIGLPEKLLQEMLGASVLARKKICTSEARKPFLRDRFDV